MLISGRVAAFRATLAARLLAVCVLAVVLTPMSAPPASADQPCPSTGVPGTNISEFETAWPPDDETDARGVTLCRLVNLSDTWGYVQIVDMADGASIGLRAQQQIGQPTPASAADWLYTKRTVQQQYEFDTGGTGLPAPGNVPTFSATNTAFFTDTSSATTKLSLPEHANNFGVVYKSWGYALHQTDPAWEAPKRKLVMGAPWSDNQLVRISPFPTYYTASEADTFAQGHYSGTVGFDPLFGSGEARRTMVGVNAGYGVYGSRVYILTTFGYYTLEQAQDILRHFGSQTEIQLDGGGSTQMYSPFGEIESYGGGCCGLSERPVPSHLMTYLDW
jgi:hypothetical protein